LNRGHYRAITYLNIAAWSSLSSYHSSHPYIGMIIAAVCTVMYCIYDHTANKQ
jgi:hypothetical protein